MTNNVKKINHSRAKRICCGKYEYRGYRLINHGYYEPDRCVWWEAVNVITGCSDYHEHTKRELIMSIDKDIAQDKKSNL